MNLRKIMMVFTLLSIFILAISTVNATAIDTFNATAIDTFNATAIDTFNATAIDTFNATAIDIANDHNSIHTITEDNYYDYFKDAGFIDGSNYTFYNKSNLINSNVSTGDIIDLSGVFRNKSFIFDKHLTITSSLNDAYLYDCQIVFLNCKDESSSTISNLNIENHVDEKTAILSMNSKNVTISNNTIYSTGLSAYPIFLSRNTTNSNVLNNIVKTTIGQGGAWQHPGILLGGSDYNYIAGNDVTVEDSNGIYLSEYSGGLSHHNIIFNNTVRSSIYNPSSWCYGIQMMGDFNLALNNTVIGTYRGISTSGNNNSIISNYIYNITGAFYEGSSGADLIGGDYSIYASYNSLVANNSIFNSKVAGSAIALCDNSTAYGNYIQIISNNYGFRIFGSNCCIYENNINFLSGTAIYSAIKLDNLRIYNNIINSVNINSPSTLGTGNGVGIYINYQSSSKRPTNVYVSNNTIYTSNKVAINLGRCDCSTLHYIYDNIFDANVILPEGYNSTNSTNSTSPTDNSTNTTIEVNTFYINENNFKEFFVDGEFTTKVNDGDTLIFSDKFSFKGQLNISKSVKIIGKNAKFFNTTFYISASNVLIDNISIDNYYYMDNSWAIKIILANNVTVTNCNISVWDKNTSYGIYVSDSIDDVFTYNNIKTHSDGLTYSIIGYELYNSTIAYNNINTIGTAKIHAYEGSISIDGEHIIGEMSKTYGIVILYSSSNIILDNSINVSSEIKNRPSEFNESTNTLIGIDLYYGSDNNIIKGNNIVVKGKDPFIYGMGVVGAIIDEKLPGSYNNSFYNNNILLNGNYFVSGIIVGNQAINTLLLNNTLNLHSSNYTYGITLEQSQKSILDFNKIYGYGDDNYGIELYSSNYNVIKNNYVYGGGEYAESMGFYDSSHNSVKNNTLISNGTHIHKLSNGTNQYHEDMVNIETTQQFGDYGTYSNWISSLDDKEYFSVVNFFSNINNGEDYNNFKFKGISNDDVAKWFNSLNNDSKAKLLDSLKNNEIDPFALADSFTEHIQNTYHADAVDLWNTPVWLESGSNSNDFEDNTMVSNNQELIKGDFDSRANNFKTNKLYYGVSNYMNKYSNSENSNNHKNKDSNSKTFINGTFNNEGSSLDGDSEGISKVGDFEGISGESSAIAYDLEYSTESKSSAYVVPLIILVLIVLFCYGFLRND